MRGKPAPATEKRIDSRTQALRYGSFAQSLWRTGLVRLPSSYAERSSETNFSWIRLCESMLLKNRASMMAVVSEPAMMA